jgi:hypothetical protein
MCEREAAEFLCMSRRQLVALCERGDGPHHMFFSGRARYSLKDLVQFCSSRNRAPISKCPSDDQH